MSTVPDESWAGDSVSNCDDGEGGRKFSSLPFDAKTGLNKGVTYIEIESDAKLYNLVTASFAAGGESEGFSSFKIKELDGKQTCPEVVEKKKCASEAKCKFRYTSLDLGLGDFSLKMADGSMLYLKHQVQGDPLATNCGTQLHTTLVLWVKGRGPAAQRKLQAYCEALIEESERVAKNTVTIYRWHVKYQYWIRDSQGPARELDSVVLPSATKDKIVGDLTEFLEVETKEWYRRHGVPYKRSYLFYGVPGTGKTSLIQALAGRFDRNVCFLQPTHPDMCDDSLKRAVAKCPANSFVVFEDMDSLFTKDRQTKVKNALTFSGMLNALDGVGSPKGQVIILTTNFRDQLDSALIRNGRVDVQIPFDYSTPEQMEKIFAAFYPESGELPQEFTSALLGVLEKPEFADPKTKKPFKVTTCVLQAYFIKMRKKKASEAVAGVEKIVEELLMRSKKGDAGEGVEKEEELKEEKKAGGEEEVKVAKKKKKKNKNKSSFRAGGGLMINARTVNIHYGNSTDATSSDEEDEEEGCEDAGNGAGGVEEEE